MVGDASHEVVFAWLVLSVTGSPAALGAVMVVMTVPRGLLVLMGGGGDRPVLAAWGDAGGASGAGDGGGGVGGVGCHGCAAGGALYGFGVVVGVAEAFFWPASASILPGLVGRRDLPRANALVGAAEQTSRLAGPMLGGVLVAGAGLSAALAFNALTFVVAAGTVLAAPRRRLESGGRLTATAVLGEIRSGLAYAGRTGEVRIVLLVVAAATLSYSGLFAVGLPALARSFDQGALVLGALLSAWGFGQLAGTLSATITGLPRRWGLLIIGSALAEGASFALLGVLPHYLLAVVLLGVLGFGVAFASDVALPAFVQTRTPPQLLGRVSSVLDLPRVALAPLSIAGMGLLATIDVRWVFAVAALPMTLTGLLLVASPRARQLRIEPPSEPPAGHELAMGNGPASTTS